MSSQEENSEPDEVTDNFAEVMSALSNNELDTFKRLIESLPANFTRLSNRSYTFLHFSVILNRYEIFTYLLSLDCYDEEIISSVLRYCLEAKPQEKYAIDLVNKCINLDDLDLNENTLLHLAMKEHFIRLSQILIERGMNIDAQNNDGSTPLHILFNKKTDADMVNEGVALMLYYGADVSICDKYGHVPFDLAVIYDRSLVAMQEILFYYTFDKHSKYKITSEVLFELLESESPLFLKIMDFVSDVKIMKGVFTSPTLFLTMTSEFLQVMIDKFSNVISKVFLSKSSYLWYEIEMTPSKNWEMLLNSCLASDIVEFIGRIKIEFLIEKLTEDQVQPKLIHDFIFYLLSYGLKVWAKDLDTVYKCYGYCQLFKFLLHMDIQESTCDIVPRIMYDIHLDLDYFLDDPHNFSLTAFTQLLYYFARPKLKNHYYMYGIEMFLNKVKDLPKVPSLVELARDETRKYLVETFELETSRQFYWLLNKLNISIYDKRVLSFEKKLYT